MYTAPALGMLAAGLCLLGLGFCMIRKKGKAANTERLMGPAFIEASGLIYYLGVICAVTGAIMSFIGIMLALP